MATKHECPLRTAVLAAVTTLLAVCTLSANAAATMKGAQTEEQLHPTTLRQLQQNGGGFNGVGNNGGGGGGGSSNGSGKSGGGGGAGGNGGSLVPSCKLTGGPSPVDCSGSSGGTGGGSSGGGGGGFSGRKLRGASDAMDPAISITNGGMDVVGIRIGQVEQHQGSSSDSRVQRSRRMLMEGGSSSRSRSEPDPLPWYMRARGLISSGSLVCNALSRFFGCSQDDGASHGGTGGRVTSLT